MAGAPLHLQTVLGCFVTNEPPIRSRRTDGLTVSRLVPERHRSPDHLNAWGGVGGRGPRPPRLLLGTEQPGGPPARRGGNRDMSAARPPTRPAGGPTSTAY